MTDSNDSSLLDSSPFGNNDSLYGSGTRQDDEFEPFAQPLPLAAEPLFPAMGSSTDRPSDPPVDYASLYSTGYPTGYSTEPQAGYLPDQSASYTNDPLARYAGEYTRGDSSGYLRDQAQDQTQDQAKDQILDQPGGYISDPLARHAMEYASNDSATYPSDPQDAYLPEQGADYGADQWANNTTNNTGNNTANNPVNDTADPLTRYANEYSTNYSSLYPSLYPLSSPSSYAGAAANEPLWSEAMPESIVYNHSPAHQKYSSQSYDQLFGAAEPFVAEEVAPPVVATSTPIVPDEPVQSLPPSAPPAAAAMMALLQEPAPQPKENQATANQKQNANEREALFNRHFAVLMDLMQHGAWPQAVAKIEAMQAEFPAAKSLENLRHEATLKAELMAEWTPKIKGRRLTLGQEWLIRRSLPFLFLFLLFISGTTFYRIFLAPSREVIAMERANQALVDEAAGLVQSGQIDEGIALYNTVLSRDPNNGPAQQGLLNANRQTWLSVIYDIAIRVANKGNLARSLLMLQSIKAKSANFRDIDARLSRVNSLLTAEAAYQLAEKAFAERRWVDAVTNYEQTQVLAPDYQTLRIASQLSAAYFYGAQKVMAEWPSDDFGPEQIRDFLRKAQEINGQDQTLSGAVDDIGDLIRGERSLHNNDIDQAIKVWRELFDKRPALLGGYLAEELYRAYLTLATGMSSSDKTQAQELYTLAAALPVRDSGEACMQLQGLGAALPPVQPMVMPQPTVSLDPSVTIASAAPVAAATPTPMPPTQAAANPAASVSPASRQPTPTPNAFQGWIAFRTTRDGTLQIYMMRNDGSEQKPAPEEVRVRLDAFYQDEQRSPDGRKLTVQNASGRADSNIFVTSPDGSQSNTLADSTANESDAVWSRIGDHIAFATNQTGNDEIWIMRGDGSAQQQLTFNSWEWDKHPTWSPDSSQIAFFSNRSGQRQIWVMNSDGSGQRNLSNNGFEDWDPVWLK